MARIITPRYNSIVEDAQTGLQKHGRRFGHPGEWLYSEAPDGDDGMIYKMYDPISDFLMLDADLQELIQGWYAFLSAQKRPRETKGWGSLRAQTLAGDGYRCRVCGTHRDQGVSLHVDHMLPVSMGGDNHLDNLRTLCEECNLARNSNPFHGLVDITDHA